jgi:hypothetical protein
MQEETSQLCLAFVRASTGGNLHDDRFADRERTFVPDQLDHPSIHVTPGGPVVLDPR